MSWYVEQFRSPTSIAIFRQQYSLNVASTADRVDFDTHLKVACQGNYLNVVRINVKLFDLSCAKTGDITSDEILIQNRILLQEAGSEPSNIHD